MILPDPLHLIIALGPLAMYLLLLGLLNLSRRPFLTTGTRDMAALGVGISGLIIAGPMELFMPEAAAQKWPGYVWLLMVAFYVLCLTLVVLLMRPRLVFYNLSVEQLRPILANVVADLDKEARWAGDCLVLPQLCVQLHVEQSMFLRCTQLVAAGSVPGWQSYSTFAGWRRLEITLRAALRGTRGSRNPYGALLVFCGLTMVSVVAFFMMRDPQSVAQAFREMLRLSQQQN